MAACSVELIIRISDLGKLKETLKMVQEAKKENLYSSFKVTIEVVADMINLAKQSIKKAYGDENFPSMPRCGGGAPNPNSSIPCPPKPKK